MLSAAKSGELITFNIEFQEFHAIQALVFKICVELYGSDGNATILNDVRTPCLFLLNMKEYSAVFFTNSHRIYFGHH